LEALYLKSCPRWNKKDKRVSKKKDCNLPILSRLPILSKKNYLSFSNKSNTVWNSTITL
jgi:hypothetical protein